MASQEQATQNQQAQGIDLSAVRHRPQGAESGSTSGAGAHGTGGAGIAGAASSGAAGADGVNSVQVESLVFATSTQEFNSVVELSMTVPVIVDLWAQWCQPCKQLSPVLTKVIESYEGKMVLATVDVDAHPQIQQAFQAQSIPTVIAIIKGQPMQLFQGTLPEAQIRRVFDQVLTVCQQNGVTGRAVTSAQSRTPTGPAHPEAHAALEAGDLEAAEQAYETVLNDTPGDQEAQQGLAHVRLLRRTQDMDAAEVRATAANNPEDIQAAMRCADLDMVGGHVEDSFARLLQVIRSATPEDKEQLRKHLLELFTVAGESDSRVTQARSRLMRALF